jgi:hypothetical protein
MYDDRRFLDPSVTLEGLSDAFGAVCVFISCLLLAALPVMLLHAFN